MVGKLLVRGMLVGLLAGVLCFGFLKIFGEPQVDRAIAVETAIDVAKAKAEADAARARGLPPPVQDDEPELVSRPVQAGIGLFTGVVIYSTAFGGLFALAFAFVHGRLGSLEVRPVSALVAAAGFVALYVVPNLKYPANPPSVGEPATIGLRTALYFGMMAISLLSLIAATGLRAGLVRRLGRWDATLVAGAAYLAAVLVAAAVLPAIDEVPSVFPAVVLWKFRMASAGAQLLMWSVLGLGFGAWMARSPARPPVVPGFRQTSF